jgi:intracellular sulfur oxidation DsrE/DsrF family protein
MKNAELKLLMHVPDSKRFEPALKMAKNFVIAVKEKKSFSVRIVVNFEGITVLNDFKPFEDLFKEALNLGIEVYFCENALKGFNIPFEKVPEGGKTVPAGIVALVEWQNEGYRYVRA